MKKLIFAAAATVLAAGSLQAQPKLTADNIDEILKALTLEEKATLCVGGGWGSMNAGSITASDDKLVPGAAGTTRPVERLGIPRTVVADGPAGLRIEPVRQGDNQTYYCTGFPVGTVLACTWNAPMVEELLAAMGNEVHEYGVDVLLAPGQNIHRNPLCGRNFEYFSEDPLLSGKISAAYVRGVQSQGVGVSIKHFAANDQEINRNENDAHINPRALREIYLKNFEITVRESDPWTVMSSYNKMNGHYTQQTYDLLTTTLRNEWGFNGIVMTDWGNKAGTVDAVHAGNDLMEPGDNTEIQRIVDGVKSGALSEADLDRNVRRMLEYIVKTPRFNGYKFSNKPDLKGHGELVRKAATEGMVLLKNDMETLPFAGVKNVALFGLNAYKTIAGGTGSGNVNKAYIRNIDEGLKDAGIAVDERLAEYYNTYRTYATADYALASHRGGVLLGEAVLPEVAVRAAAIDATVQRNDAAIVVIGRNAGEGDDRRIDGDFELTQIERELLQNVSTAYHKVGKKVVVILNIGGVIETSSWKGMADAILLAWTPGQEAGMSIADVLTGKANPSGKLSMTFPVNYFDIPSSQNFPYAGNQRNAGAQQWGQWGGQQRGTKDIDYTDYKEGIWVGYRYFNTANKPVSFPFGYGLSYTTFEYSKPSVKTTSDGIVATITVKNTGKVAGKEAVQLYVSAPAGGLVKPAVELKGFAKTKELQPGQSETLTIKVDAYTLASFNEEASEWQTAAGNYTAKFAANVEDVRATAQFKISKAKSWKVEKVMLPETPVQEIAVK
ncbi:MAG: glycoside hydrolase family 3 C-terminal domain-containing protein [Bacteroidaceae bacterium]|nr:glycoside hydrolase family 3 C-terminal domain-containing protein [Bacteroidaceae bacterium]